MAVEVVLDRLSVDVLHGDGLLRKPKPGLVLEEGQQPREEDMVVTGDSTLVSLAVHSVRVQYVQKSDSSMTCDVYIENLNLEDVRAGIYPIFILASLVCALFNCISSPPPPPPPTPPQQPIRLRQ